MALVTRFDTPASLRDLPEGSPFYRDWHNYLAASLNTTAATGTATGEFYDASEVDVGGLADRSLVWMAFPRRVLVAHRDDRRAAFAVADDEVATRRWQDEYCEWRVTRNAEGKITSVVFVAETPEYWERLWAADPARVVELYQELVDPGVGEADLRVGGPGSGYNRFNRFNTTDGIVHLIQPTNTLDAALRLAQGSIHTNGTRDNYEVFASADTSVGPRVQLDIGALARTGQSLTLRDPIGPYIACYDDSGWTEPDDSPDDSPDGAPVGNYWRIVRFTPGRILRLEYRVPEEKGFVVGDIRIGGRPIEWGGQIAEHITCTIGGVAGRRGKDEAGGRRRVGRAPEYLVPRG
jgi:hypothetical protein